MQVSRLLIVFCLAWVASLLFIASPAIAVEHPWEEGEGGSTGGDLLGSGLPDPTDDSFPPPSKDDPLLTSSSGPFLFWWQVIWDSLLGKTEDQGIVHSSSATGYSSKLLDDSDRRQKGSIIR
jgi:hypothetical protein